MQISWTAVALFIAVEHASGSSSSADVPLTALGSSGGGGASADPTDFMRWSLRGQLLFLAAVGLGLKAVCWIVLHGFALLCAGRPPIAIGGAHLDALSGRDRAFIAFNRLTVPFVTLHITQFVWHAPTVAWGGLETMTLANTLGSLLAFFALYDLVYVGFHRALHHPSVYGLVHKHHHQQKAPSRGNEDAVNVHPFEFVSGEYLHLACMWAVPSHVAANIAFMVVGGVLASLNHTRHDFNVGGSGDGGMGAIYSVKAHDVHHAHTFFNYGQYTMLWDRLLGTFRPWAPPRKLGQGGGAAATAAATEKVE
jgi:sterol desaturase/sphingolipid hydroxylase (fatty acid hydroxylase superfamily)